MNDIKNTLIKVDINLVSLDEIEYPDLDDKRVFDQLKQFYSLNSFLIPNITLVEDDNRFLVKKGQKVFRIIKELEYQSVNGILDSSLGTKFVRQNIQLGHIILRDFKTEAANAESNFPEWHWHLFYFENRLTSSEIERIIELFRNFNQLWVKSEFEQEYKLNTDLRGLAVCLFSKVPDTRKWTIEYYKLAKNIHTQYKRIETINGMKLRYSLPYIE